MMVVVVQRQRERMEEEKMCMVVVCRRSSKSSMYLVRCGRDRAGEKKGERERGNTKSEGAKATAIFSHESTDLRCRYSIYPALPYLLHLSIYLLTNHAHTSTSTRIHHMLYGIVHNSDAGDKELQSLHQRHLLVGVLPILTRPICRHGPLLCHLSPKQSIIQIQKVYQHHHLHG